MLIKCKMPFCKSVLQPQLLEGQELSNWVRDMTVPESHPQTPTSCLQLRVWLSAGSSGPSLLPTPGLSGSSL